MRDSLICFKITIETGLVAGEGEVRGGTSESAGVGGGVCEIDIGWHPWTFYMIGRLL